MPRYSAPYKGCTAKDISQGWKMNEHTALDIIKRDEQKGRATPLTAPEDVQIVRISGETLTHDTTRLENGYGVYMKGLESGTYHLYWHAYPTFPVKVGDIVRRGQIVAFMSNSGKVYSKGVYVPIKDRLHTDDGTHLHWENFEDLQGFRKINTFDFTGRIDWNLQPTYTWMEHKLAILKAVLKAQQLLDNQ